MLLADAAPTVAETATKFVGEFMLGGISLLAIGVAYWAIKQLKAAKDAHIEALNAAADKKDETSEKHAAAYQKTATATVAAIEKLTVTETAQTDAIRENTRALTDLRSSVDGQTKTIDSVIRDAVKRGRSSSDRWPAQRKPEGGE